MATNRLLDSHLGRPAVDRLTRRIWPLVASAVYVILGLLKIFRWGSVGWHIPSLWISPNDLYESYVASSLAVHGHIGAIYQVNNFAELPGILVALAPLAALSGAFHTPIFQVLTQDNRIPAHSLSAVVHIPNEPFLNAQQFHSTAGDFVSHPQWILVVAPYALALSCLALFALDALAERLQISPPRRILLCGVEAFVMWNMTVWWGHPEDAVAVGLAVYSLIFILDKRFTRAGWFFGAAVAFQPLVLLMLPVLMAIVGRRRMLVFATQSLLPAAVLLAAPLIANFRATTHSVVDQPNFPKLNHPTPWTALAPSLGGHGLTMAVADGPGRLVALAIAIGIAIWAVPRWRTQPELLVWSCALTLALRSFTESVMLAYYPWPAVALLLIVAARAGRGRFGTSIVVAIAMTTVAQSQIAWLPWWIIQITGLTVLLIVAFRPESPAAPTRPTRPAASRSPAVSRDQRGAATARRNQRGSARSPAVSQGRQKSGTATKKKGSPPAGPTRSGRR